MRLPRRCEKAVFYAMEERGVRLFGVSDFYRTAQKAPAATIVLGYTGFREDELVEAAKPLTQAWFF